MVYSVDRSGSLSMTLAYIHVSEVETNKVWKTQQAMIYSIDLSGSLSMTLEYVYASKMETSKV